MPGFSRYSYICRQRNVASFISIVEEGGMPRPMSLRMIRRSRKNKPDPKRIYTALEMLTDFYRINCFHEIRRYVETFPDVIEAESFPEGTEFFRLYRCTYIRTQSVMDQLYGNTAVDFIYSGLVEGEFKSRLIRRRMLFRVRYFLDLRPPMHCLGRVVCIISDLKRNSLSWQDYMLGRDDIPEDGMIRFDEYLMPILYKKDYRELCRRMIRRYYPETDPENIKLKVSPRDLAKRMSIRIREVSCSDTSVLGKLFYQESYIKVKKDDGQRDIREHVKPMTLYINTDRCQSEESRNTVILRACVQMYLHLWFWLLQIATGNRWEAYTIREPDGPWAEYTPLGVMESQCDQMMACIRIEKEKSQNRDPGK